MAVRKLHEEILGDLVGQEPVHRPLRDYSNPLHRDVDFLISRYRFSRRGIIEIINIVGRDSERPTRRGNALPPVIIVSASLKISCHWPISDFCW
jgi:hypothetical protein